MKKRTLLYSGLLTLATLVAMAAMRPAAMPDVGLRQPQSEVGAIADIDMENSLRRAARRGSASAQLLLGQILAAQGVPGKLPEAVGWLTAAAKAGEAKADLALGKLYLAGAPGFPPIPAQARQRLQSAARQGEGGAAYLLALMYKNGIGMPRDSQAAARWLAVAADKQMPTAMMVLADMHFSGEGMIADPAQVRHWTELAANLEPPEASRMLAIGLRDGSMEAEEHEGLAGLR
jgi:uncharacterized protein